MIFKIDLGVKAKDKITGFEGHVTGRCEYLTGCAQYLLQPPVKDGDYKDGRWFDEGRLEVLASKEAIDPKSVQGDEKGACGTAPVK